MAISGRGSRVAAILGHTSISGSDIKTGVDSGEHSGVDLGAGTGFVSEWTGDDSGLVWTVAGFGITGRKSVFSGMDRFSLRAYNILF